MSFPSLDKVDAFLGQVAHPALTEVSEELREYAVTTDVQYGENESGLPCAGLTVELSDAAPFRYRIVPQEALMPVVGDRTLRQHDVFYRLEVHLNEGGQGYDVMGYTYTQLIDDVLDRYEQHIEFLRLNAEATSG